MNEDEAIKKLQEMIGLCTEKPKHIAYNEQRAIETILDLYKQEKAKNKELENNYDKLTKHFIKNHISKDKIREFIKKETFEGTYSFDLISAKRLKELLEGE